MINPHHENNQTCKKTNLVWVTLFLFIITFNSSCAQEPKPSETGITTPYSPYGGVFTPKGTLRALIVFVTYKDKCSTNPKFENKKSYCKDWDYTKNNCLPKFVNKETGDCPTYIYNKEEDFEKYKDEVKINFSTEFALMSKNKFKLIGEVFKNAKGKPTVVEIDPTGGASWTQMNGLAVEKMRALNPNIDLSDFDQRKNSPQYMFDNSDTSIHKPDKIIDFVVFVHRYNKGWKKQPKSSMRSWVGSGGGFAATGVLPQNKLNGYRFAEGFTMTYRSGVFVHEVAHVLFNAPHIMGVNNVVGDFFYLMSGGWGIMSPLSIFSGFNAWENWYCGFSEPVADIKNEEDLKNGNSFILRDYMTTGDAIRVEIPFSGGQHIWLENHAKIHPLDEHPWKGLKIGKEDTLASTAPGIYAFVEAIEGSRNVIFSALSNRANGIKVLNAGGNYDYHVYKDKPDLKNNWGNVLKSFKRLDENPISGTNNFYRYPYDENGDGFIKIDPNYNSSRTERYPSIIREEIKPDSFVNTYSGFGVFDPVKSKDYARPVAFGDGDYLDMSSNPLPLNYPRYIMRELSLQAYILNGLAIKFSKVKNSKDMRVEIKFKHTNLCQDRRWTGKIELPNITGDDKADLEISNCIQLTLNKSGTANRHIKTDAGDFINLTTLTIKKGATLHLKQKSKLILEEGSKLILEDGANLILDKRAQLIIKADAELLLNNNSIQKHNSAKVIKQGK